MTIDRPASGGPLDLVVRIVSPEKVTGVPLLMVPGGPGLADADSWAANAARFPRAFAGREVIFYDPRGTGQSGGVLGCAERWSDEEECFASISPPSVDRWLYSGRSLAADVVALRHALGVEVWDLHATSYGAEIARHVMDLDADAIRSVVLAGPSSIATAQPLEYRTAASEALSAFVRDCTRERYCDEANPDLFERFVAVRSELDDRPFELVDGSLLDGDMLAWKLVSALRDWRTVDRLGQLITAAEQRSADPFAATTAATTEHDSAASTGYVPWLVAARLTLCADGAASGAPELISACGPWFTDDAAYREVHDDYVRSCEIAGTSAWPRQLTASSTPTLVISGAIDPVTPSSEAASILTGLTSGQFVELPWYAHEGFWEDPCPQFVMYQFWADPLAPVDDGCVGALTYENIYSPDCSFARGFAVPLYCLRDE